MARVKIRVLRTVPGSTVLGPILSDFCRKGDGVVTAFSDSALPLAHRFVDEDDAVEVLPFGELVSRVLRLCGEETLPLAKSGHTLASVAVACRELEDSSPFYRGARFAGLHQAIVRTLKELHDWGIDADEIDRLAERSGPRLAEKLRSLAQIDRQVELTLSELGCQSHAAQMRACLECTPERDGSFERMLVLAGSEDSPLRTRWLQWVAAQGTDVTVIVDRHATDAPLFAGAVRTTQTLGGTVKDKGDGNRLTKNLFAREESSGPAIDVLIQSAPDPLAEVEWALRGCQANPEQAAIYVRDLESYAPLLESASRRLGVPVRLARRSPLLTNSFARLSLAALEFCAGNDVRALGTILRSSYLGLGGEAQNRVQSSLKDAHSSRALQWDTLRQWSSTDGADIPWLSVLLEWRHRALAGRFSLREWQVLLTELIDHRDLPWSTRRETSEVTMAERDRRARNQLQRLLANYVSIDSVTDRASVNLAEVVAICRRLWEESDVSVPTGPSGVLVTDQVDTLTDADHLHVLGMLEGVFPRRRSEEPILTDTERAEISSLRPEHPRLLDSHDRAAAERDAFYRVVSAARRRLIFSYPQADDQRDNIPAFYLTEVARAAGEVKTEDVPRLHLAPDLGACANPADTSLRAAMDGPREMPLSLELVTQEVRDQLRPAAGYAYSPAELRDVLLCPFQYLARHRLKLSVKRSRARWQSLRKLPQAAGLMRHETPRAAESALIQALDAELDLLYSEVDDWEMQLLRAGGQRLIRDWLRREFTAREIWPKEEGTLRTGASFGTEGLRAKMPGEVTIDGSVPAISRFQGYSVAHLYGGSPRDAKKLTEEERLYFGLYFLALHESGREGALEIESMSGKRELIVLSRTGGQALSNVAAGLSVVDLSTQDDANASRRQFFEDVKRALRRAIERVQDVRVDAMKGDHCDVCDFGELCRRSRIFGEEDSPFGPDLVLQDV